MIIPLHSQTITAELTNIDGCTATASVKVQVEINRNVYTPNAFSPNNDGVNDVWIIGAGPQVKAIADLGIFNRYGDRIFFLKKQEINRELKVWDGTFKGQALSQGVFMYRMTVIYEDGKKHERKGSITLLR